MGIVRQRQKHRFVWHLQTEQRINMKARLSLERRGADSLAVVNELPLERYLLGVVPHEMPTSFGQTALEAQAITARSYAYNQFYANTYCAYGAHVTRYHRQSGVSGLC